jgi:hypothetical protein
VRSAAPVLSESVLERMQAAVDASRTEPAVSAPDPITEPIPRITASGPAAAASPARPAPGGAQSPPARRRRPRRAHPVAAASSLQSVPAVPTRTVPTPAADLQPPPAANPPVAPLKPSGQPEPAAAPPRSAEPGGTRQSGQPARPSRAGDADAAQAWPPESALYKPQDPPDAPAAPAKAPPGRLAPPDHHARGRRFGNAWLAAAAVVILAVAAGGIALALGTPRPAGNDHKLTPLQRQAALNRTRTTKWIADQVTPGTSIACDQQMCKALAASGYLTRDLHVLGATTAAPLSDSLVIETAAVRGQFGSSLDSAIAPLAIATIGSGPARISIRLVAPDGVAAFRRALAAGQATRRQNEAALPGGGQITTSAAAQADLASGRADMRLVLAIAYLAAALPVDIVGFGNEAAGASADVPLRFADLSENGHAAHLASKAYVSALLAAEHTVPGPYRPLWAKFVRLSSGVSVLRLDVGAPSPFGVPASPDG